MHCDPHRGRLARVIASDVVEYFRAADSPFAGSESCARELASHGVEMLRARFGEDGALERYYADCLGSAFESLHLPPPSLASLCAGTTPFAVRHPPRVDVPIVVARTAK